MNVSALQEYERLCQNSNLENIHKICVTDDTIATLLLNVRSFSKLACGIKRDGRLMRLCLYLYLYALDYECTMFHGNAATTFTKLF